MSALAQSTWRPDYFLYIINEMPKENYLVSVAKPVSYCCVKV